MIMMKFTGPKTSMGYVPQGVYPLDISIDNFNGKAMIVVRCSGHSACPYESMDSFLKNWDKA